MPDITCETESFNANVFGVVNGAADMTFTLDELLHAAVSAGHDQDFAVVLGAELAGSYEMLWKAYALLLCVREDAFPRQVNPNVFVGRFVSTDRFWLLDPSEKRGATYHVGMLLAVAWARRVLNVPWLLHLDVYRNRLNPQLQPGNSRPDLLGMDAAGRWVVIECKGRSTPPDEDAKDRAKFQAQRVVNIGGQIPSLAFAFFSFFGADRAAQGRSKPWVLRALVVDPEPENSGDNIELPDLTPSRFFRLYYEPLRELFAENQRVEEHDGIATRYIEALDLRVSVGTETRELLLAEQYEAIADRVDVPREVVQISPALGTSVGDGIVVAAGDRWRERIKSRR